MSQTNPPDVGIEIIRDGLPANHKTVGLDLEEVLGWRMALIINNITLVIMARIVTEEARW